MSRILLVGHDLALLRTLADDVTGLGHRPVLARSGEEALGLMSEEGGIGALIAECVMPEMDGFALLTAVVKAALRVPVLLVGPRDEASATTALRLGAADVLSLPLPPGRLAASLQMVLRLSALEDIVAAGNRAAEGRPDLADMLAETPGVERAVAQAARAARSDVPVLVEGEAGVGKNLLARAIHSASARVGKPFIRLDCAALPPAELEARLFGRRVRGADIEGAVEAARGGTLYLSDIGALPLPLQERLLTLLETSEFRPQGSPRALRADIRLIAGTRIRLLNLAKSGEVNEALFYRLGVMPIYLPPLRDRAADLDKLVRRALLKAGAELGKPVSGLKPEAETLVRRFAWPGNLRELETTLYRAAALSPGAEIEPAALPHLAAQAGHPDQYAPLGAMVNPVPVDSAPRVSVVAGADRFLLDDGEVKALADVERDLIAFALERHGSHMSKVARALGIGRSTLYRKLAEYGLDAALAGEAA